MIGVVGHADSELVYLANNVNLVQTRDCARQHESGVPARNFA